MPATAPAAPASAQLRQCHGRPALLLLRRHDSSGGGEGGRDQKSQAQGPQPGDERAENQQTSVFSKNLQDIQQVDFVFFG